MSMIINSYLVESAVDTKYFTFSVNTANAGSASDTIVLPFTTDQDLTIEWDSVGDPGTTEDITTAVAATHTYSSSGTYVIKIQETAGGFVKYLKFDNAGDKAKILDISSWDALDLTDNDAFYGCGSLILSATNIPLITTTSFANMFRNTAISSFPGGMDTSSVTNFSNVCHNISELTTEPDWDTSVGTVFVNALKDTGITECTWDLTSMINGIQMFNGVTLTTTSWSNLLVATEANNVDTDCVWDGGNSLRNASGDTAHAALLARTPGWTITDGTP